MLVLLAAVALWIGLAVGSGFVVSFLAGFGAGLHNSVAPHAPRWQLGQMALLLAGSAPLQAVLLLGAWLQGRSLGRGHAAAGLGAGAVRHKGLLAGLLLLQLVLTLGWAGLVVRWIGAPPTMVTAQVLRSVASGGIGPIVVLGLLFVLVAPVCEEMFFRGWLWTSLRQRWPAVPTAIVTASPWLALHVADGGWRRVLFLVPAAVMLSVARHVCGSVRASIIMHMCNNASAAALVILSLWAGG